MKVPAIVLALWCTAALGHAQPLFLTADFRPAVIGHYYEGPIRLDGGGGCPQNQPRFLVAGVLPAGLSIHHDGVLRGTPQVTGMFPLRLRAATPCETAESSAVLEVRAAPVIFAFPQELSFEIPQGEGAPGKRLRLEATWPHQPYEARLRADAPWVTLSRRGGIIPGPPSALPADTLTVGLQAEKLAAGDYRTEITIWTPQAVEPTRIPVSIRVRPNDQGAAKEVPPGSK